MMYSSRVTSRSSRILNVSPAIPSRSSARKDGVDKVADVDVVQHGTAVANEFYESGLEPVDQPRYRVSFARGRK